MAMPVRFSLDSPRKPRKREEASLQVKLVNDLRLYLLPKGVAIFAVPNGGKRDVVEAVNLRRQGVMAGVPDLILIWEGRAYGLELKSDSGRISDAQAIAFPVLRDAGMRIEVARSYNDALRLIADMGIPLRINERKYEIKDVFRDAKRRAA